MGIGGPQCDRERFASLILRNIALLKFRNGYSLDLDAIAEYTRGELAYAIRNGPFQTNLLMGGLDSEEKAKLYYLDYMGTLQQMTKAAHGYAAYFVSSILDNGYKVGLSQEDGLELMKKCASELKTRFLID